MLILGALGLLGTLGSVVSPSPTSNPFQSLLVALSLLAFGTFLLRGQGIDPRVATRRAAESQRRAAEAQRQAALAVDSIEQAAQTLAWAHGGAAVVAYRNLDATVKRFHPNDGPAYLGAVLAWIQFDPARLVSPGIGLVRCLDGAALEVFRDWVIRGQESHDIDATTRGSVHVDGAVQVVAVPMPTGKGTMNQAHDLRTAQVNLASATWSLSAAIHPDQAGAARLVIDRLAANIESMKPRGVTSDDLKLMVDTILNNSGQPPAEKLKQLSNLRFERLLSDDQFEAAKARILGI